VKKIDFGLNSINLFNSSLNGLVKNKNSIELKTQMEDKKCRQGQARPAQLAFTQSTTKSILTICA
jgi:hypothetical protein